MSVLPQVSISTDMSDGLCFGCGQNNAIGLKLGFKPDGNGVRAECTPGKLYQGWPGVVHGGIITCLLDEAMSYAAISGGDKCLTARMEVKFSRPAPVEEPLVVTSSVTRNTRKLVETKSMVCLRDGTVIAEATAKQFVIEAASGEMSRLEGDPE